MRAVLQRVSQARVRIDDHVFSQIERGLVVFLGIAKGDTLEDARYLARKVARLRIFADSSSKFNLSALDLGARALVVSQFTLLADTRKGLRPSFEEAAPPQVAEPLVESFISSLRAEGLSVETGRFQAHMLVEIINEGPVTIILDSRVRRARVGAESG